MHVINEPVPRVGEAAPDFTLASTAGADVTLSSFRGRSPVLLAFFPLAFTSTCTAEVCEFSEDFDRFSAEGVAVLPISVDSTATLREFKQKHGLRTDLLSDFKRQAGQRYGVMWRDSFYTNRAYFLLDKDGVIQWEHVEETPSGKRDPAEIFLAISKLKPA